MKITEIRVKIADDRGPLLAWFNVTFDGVFVVRDIRLILNNDRHIVAMPSRRRKAHCPNCNYKNYVQARYCSHCGYCLEDHFGELDRDEAEVGGNGSDRDYFDLAHPIDSKFREELDRLIIAAYEVKLGRSGR
ncbi:MAG: septation protein SpoVG family protein [Bdellovibrionales bacterium]|nr:septation protein SpoVG family protein [Bdellovibrionales bacterium]